MKVSLSPDNLELRLKKWPEYRNYKILDEGLNLEYRTTDSFNQQTVKFEDVDFDVQLVQYKPSSVVSFLFISVFFNIISLFVFLIKVLKDDASWLIQGLSVGVTIVFSALGIKLFKFEKIKYIKGNLQISFWYFDKCKDEVDKFVEQLSRSRRNYFRKKYLLIEEVEDFQSIKNKLFWLKSLNYVDDLELQEWMIKAEKRTVIKGF